MDEEMLSGAMDEEEVQDAAEQEIDDTQEEPEIEDAQEEVPAEEPQDDTVTEEEAKQYYKSQQEVDKAFGHRLRSAQDKWHKDHTLGIELERRYRALYGNKEPDEILNDIDTQIINQMADKLGTTYEMAEWLYTHNQQDIAEQQVAAPPQPQTQFDADFVQGLIQQEAVLKGQYPDFDLASTIQNNQTFAQLIVSGVPVETAFYATFPDRIKKQVESQVVERIKNRNMRPSEMKKPAGDTVKVDIEHMTDEQILELSQRARRGERIQF